MHRTTGWLALGLSLSLFGAGCGSTAQAPSAPAAAPAAAPATAPATAPAAAPATSSAPATPKPLQKATLRLDWTVQGYHAPFYLALARGYYKDAGIDLSIGAGKGSPATGEAVAAGHDTFGVVDAGVMMNLVGKGLREKMVMGVLQKSPNAVIYNPASGIATPKDLVGKHIGFTPGEAPYVLLPAFLQANGLRMSQLHMVAAAFQPKYKGLVSGQLDGMTGFSYTGPPLLGAMGMKTPAKVFIFSDYGVNVPSLGIVVGDKTAAKSPALVRGFLQATVKGFQAAQADPKAAMDALMAANPGQGLNPTLQQQILVSSFALLSTKNTAGHPLGWMSAKDWSEAQALLVKYQGIKPVADVSQYYSDQFLPGS